MRGLRYKRKQKQQSGKSSSFSIGHKGRGFKSVLEIRTLPQEGIRPRSRSGLDQPKALRCEGELIKEVSLSKNVTERLTRFLGPRGEASPSDGKHYAHGNVNTAFRLPLRTK